MGVNPNFWALGPTSTLICEEASTLSYHGDKMSVILIDRVCLKVMMCISFLFSLISQTIDMVGVMLPDDSNNFMDQIIRNFESVDGSTDLSKFVPKVFGMETMEASLVPKFTSNTSYFNDIDLAKLLIEKNQKESLGNLYLNCV